MVSELRVQLRVHCVCVCEYVLTCASARTRERLASVVKLLVSGTIHTDYITGFQ